MSWWALRRRVHSSWLIAIASVGCVAGVWLASVVPLGWFGSISWLLTGATLLLSTLYWRYVLLIPACILGGLLVGLWRGSVSQVQLTAYQSLVGQTVEVTGVVAEDADVKESGTVLRLKDIRYDGRALPGTLWVTVGDADDVWRSDVVTLSGNMSGGFGAFAGALYRADIINVQRPEPGDVALRARNWFSGLVQQVIPEPASSLGLGYLLGQRRSLPPELQNALQIAGLTHVIVASGYNLTILVRLARRLFAKISRFAAVGAASAMVVSFIAVTGNSPSMSRAGLVTGLSLLAWYYGRTIHPLVLLPFAAAITVLAKPSYAWNDAGWQLSFAAFAGVMLLAPLLQAYFFGGKKPGVLRQIVGETLSAQIATLPILVVTFGQLSNVALVANMLILPLVPLAMLLTFAAGLTTALWLPLGALVALPATWLLNYMVFTATFLADQPWAQTELNVGWLFALLYYALLIAAGVYMWRVTKYNFAQSNIVE